MAKKIAFLEYAFMFDPDKLWSNVFVFEDDLSKFFSALGYDATLINSVQGTQGRRIIFLTKKNDIIDDPKKAKETLPAVPKGKKVKL